MDKYHILKEEYAEKEKSVLALNNEKDVLDNEIAVLTQKSQLMMREAKSETAYSINNFFELHHFRINNEQIMKAQIGQKEQIIFTQDKHIKEFRQKLEV